MTLRKYFRPEKKTGGRKGGSGGLAAAGIIQQSTTALAAGCGSTAENVLQALIINNNCGVTLKPKDLNVILSSQKPTLLPPKGSQLHQGNLFEADFPSLKRVKILNKKNSPIVTPCSQVGLI